GAALALVDPQYVPALTAAHDELTTLRIVVTTTGSDLAPGASDHVAWHEVSDHRAPDLPDVSPRDVGSIMYTSGTTGPSKGVLMPHAHMYCFALHVVEQLELTPDDRYLVTLPLFHANAQLM